MTPQEVITEARAILNDEDVVSYRYADARLLTFVNDWAKNLAKVKPALFHTTQDLTLTAGVETQEVSRSTTLGIADVLRTSAGARIRKVPKDQIEDHLRFSHASGAYEPELWCPVEGDPWRFVVYPKPVNTNALKVVARSDASELLRAYGTQAMADKGLILPPLYNVAQTLSMASGSAEQSVSRSTTFGLVDVTSNAGGGRVMKVERKVIEEMLRFGSSGDAVAWCPVDGDPWRFRVWPTPSTAASLMITTALQDQKTLAAYGAAMRDPKVPPHAMFNATASFTMTANSPHQEVSRTTTLGIVDVAANASGKHVIRVTPEQMDDLHRNSAQSAPCLWCPVEGDPWRFLVWPVPSAAANLNVVVQSRQEELIKSFGLAFMKSKDMVLPDTMNVAQDLAMVSGQYFQEVPRSTTMGVVDVTQNSTGKPVRRVTREYIDDMMRNTFPAQNTTPELWAPDPEDPWRFMVFPKPSGAVTIKVVSILTPTDVTISAQLVPGNEYRASAANYVAARALMANTSTADAPKASALFQLSAQLAGNPGAKGG